MRWITVSSHLKRGYICHFSSGPLYKCAFYIAYRHHSFPEQGEISQQGLKLLTCQKADRIIALYRSSVISRCVIRNSAEFPYPEEEERRPWGKLRLWQGFIISIAPAYIDFVPSSQMHKHMHVCSAALMSFQNHNCYQVDSFPMLCLMNTLEV